MSFYPEKVSNRIRSAKNVGDLAKSNAEGKGASFVCGVSIQFVLQIDNEKKQIIGAKFRTNGCGFVMATADCLAEKIIGRLLTELHGLKDLEDATKDEIGIFSDDRKHCSDICFEALYDTLAKYRESQVEEWTGEKALICSCFGIAGETIEKMISEKQLKTVEEVGENCNAGRGCGSCQPLIQEILDSEMFG